MQITYEVGELADQISRALARAFPEEIWVKGQIRNLSRPRSGHVYFSLIDASAGSDDNAAQLPVTLFAGDKDAVNHALTRSGAGRMDDGVEVRVRGMLTHFAARGTVQLRMTWIDTDFTLGRLAAQRAALLRRLAAAGHLERNKLLRLATVPLRVGLVTSIDSAAHADFMASLRASGWAFQVFEIDTRVQGADAPAAVANSIGVLGKRQLDVVAIVRGGGSALDLAAFDSEEVAMAIANCPVPVITGIGHEIDTPVAGEVAHSALKTPTSCAQFLVERVGGAARRVELAAVAVRRLGDSGLRAARRGLEIQATATARAARLKIQGAGALLTRSSQQLGTVARLVLDRRAAGLSAESERLAQSSLRGARQATRRLDAIEARVQAADPRHLLVRGWSVTRDAAGDVVRTVEGMTAGLLLRTTVADGEIASRVEEQT